MCGWRAAPFLWQKGGFSCRDAHGFNRNSSTQVAVCVWLIDFSTCYRRIFMETFAILSLFSGAADARSLATH